MNDLYDDANWDLLRTLLHIWLWRNEPALATSTTRARRIHLDDDLRAQLASYVN